MELDTLRELYIDELKDLYSAEKQLVKALPKMVKNATNPTLKKAFSDHLARHRVTWTDSRKSFRRSRPRPAGRNASGWKG